MKPGASRTAVGGSSGAGELLVAVTAHARDGKASEAAVRALADAFGIRPAGVRLLSGSTSRSKVVEVAGEEASVAKRLAELLRAGR